MFHTTLTAFCTTIATDFDERFMFAICGVEISSRLRTRFVRWVATGHLRGELASVAWAVIPGTDETWMYHGLALAERLTIAEIVAAVEASGGMFADTPCAIMPEPVEAHAARMKATLDVLVARKLDGGEAGEIVRGRIDRATRRTIRADRR